MLKFNETDDDGIRFFTKKFKKDFAEFNTPYFEKYLDVEGFENGEMFLVISDNQEDEEGSYCLTKKEVLELKKCIDFITETGYKKEAE